MSKRKGIREIPYGFGDPDETCIYDNGHIEPKQFLERVRAWGESGLSDLTQDAFWGLTPSDVQHLRFRPLSPTEARSHGWDWGVMTTSEGGYPVTAVIL